MYENLFNNLFDCYPFIVRDNDLKSHEFMKTSVRESKDYVIYEIEMPGIKKENIEINLDGDKLKVSAKNSDDFNLKDGEKMLFNERTSAAFKRTYLLSKKYNPEQIEANYENGLLTIRLTKMVEEVKSTKIEIK